jgi:hypothetical protein
VSLLEQVERAAGVAVDLTDAAAAGSERDEEIATYLAANTEVLEVVQALEQQYDAFARAEQEGSSLLADDEPIPTGRRSAGSSSSSWPASTAPRARLMPVVRRGARRAPRHRDPRHRPLPGQQPRHRPAAVFGGQVAAQALIAAHPDRRRGARRALAARLLPAPGDTTIPIIYDAERIRDGARSRPGGWSPGSTATDLLLTANFMASLYYLFLLSFDLFSLFTTPSLLTFLLFLSF